MNLQKCKNGHFYDGDLYSSCPHCENSDSGENITVPFPFPNNDDAKTVALSNEIKTVSQNTSANVTVSNYSDDDQKTISIYNISTEEKKEIRPTVGWLVCKKGIFFGQDFCLKSGRNFIGRGKDMDVCLEGENSVSRERHATIIYEPKQNIFLAQPGDSRELFYLNGSVVLSPTVLKKNDVLQVGEVLLMLIPCCDENFNWPVGNKK